MASAIRRLLDDLELAGKLVANGLDVVARDFDWERRTDEFAEVLDGLSAGTALAPPPRRLGPPTDPDLSIVVLAWDNLEYTQQFVESVRRNTSVVMVVTRVCCECITTLAPSAAINAAKTSVLYRVIFRRSSGGSWP